MKFCLLTLAGTKSSVERSDFAFFLTQPDQLQDEVRRFALTIEDFALLNPNTRTCPIFRSRIDADLTKRIYSRVPVLVNENDPEYSNPWGIKFSTMFHMSNDSHLFKTKDDMERMGFELEGNIFRKGDKRYLPLYEAKMTQIYDHRAADVVISETAMIRQGQTDVLSDDNHTDIHRVPISRYWISSDDVESAIPDDYHRNWLLGFTDVTSPTNMRTFLPVILPRVGVGHTLPLVLPQSLMTAS